MNPRALDALDSDEDADTDPRSAPRGTEPTWPWSTASAPSGGRAGSPRIKGRCRPGPAPPPLLPDRSERPSGSNYHLQLAISMELRPFIPWGRPAVAEDQEVETPGGDHNGREGCGYRPWSVCCSTGTPKGQTDSSGDCALDGRGAWSVGLHRLARPMASHTSRSSSTLYPQGGVCSGTTR